MQAKFLTTMYMTNKDVQDRIDPDGNVVANKETRSSEFKVSPRDAI